VLPADATLRGPLALFARVTAPLRNSAADPANQAKLSEALTSLGPSYIKLGQFLATRDHLIGRELARALCPPHHSRRRADLPPPPPPLQGRLPPFSHSQARAAVEEALGAPIDTLYAEFGPA